MSQVENCERCMELEKKLARQKELTEEVKDWGLRTMGKWFGMAVRRLNALTFVLNREKSRRKHECF